MNDDKSFFDEAYEKSLQSYKSGTSLRKILLSCLLIMTLILALSLIHISHLRKDTVLLQQIRLERRRFGANRQNYLFK